MAILQASATLLGGSSLNAKATWVDVDSGPEVFAGNSALNAVARWTDVDLGQETLVGWGTLIVAARLVDVDTGPELFAGGGPSNPRTNLFAQSNNFSSSPWLSPGVTETPGQSDPFGTSTAWAITEDLSLGTEHYLSYPVSGINAQNPYTHSFYVNGNLGKNYVSLRVFSNPTNTSSVAVRFNLALNNFDQDVTNGGATHSYTATNVGNGWWYLTHTFDLNTNDTAADIRIELLSGDGTTNTNIYDGDGTTGVSICNAQLETGTVATSYIPTTTDPRLLYSGSALVANAARLVPASALLTGSGGLITTSISYRAFFQGNSQLVVNTKLLAEPLVVYGGQGTLLASASVMCAGSALIAGSGTISSQSWLLAVRKGSESGAESEPEISTPELVEANLIAQQILSVLASAATVRTSVPGAAVKSAIANLQANAQEFLEDGVFAAPFFNCFEQVRNASATYETMDQVRQIASGLNPTFPTSKWIANIAVSFSLIEQAQILAVTQFVCRADIDHYIDLVTASFDPAIVAAADRLDNVTYVSLIKLQGAVINDLNIRARPLPWAIKFVLPRSFPSLWLSQRIFGDGTHNDDLIHENKPIHPLFMPPVVIGFSPP